MLTISRIFRALSLAAVLAALLPTTSQAQRPVLTKNVDERGLVPYMSSVQSFCLVDGDCVISTFKPVPAGFRLVITHVSCYYVVITAVGHLPNYAYVGSSSGDDVVYIPITIAPINSFQGGAVGSTPLTFYVEPGAKPVLTLANTGLASYPQATIVGYLVAIN